MKAVDRLMRQGVAEGVFPGGVLHVRANGRDLFHEAYGQADIFSGQTMTPDTVFDLASLTKPLATAPAVLMLVQEGRLGLRDRIGDLLPDFNNTDKGAVTLAQLLTHTAGFPAYREYFLTLAALSGEERSSALRRLLAAEPLEYAPGTDQLYSDLGYMALKYVVEAVAGKPLDHFVQEAIFSPLGVDDLFFIDLNDPAARAVLMGRRLFAATEDCPRRRRLLKGMVHDDNAYEAGGIGGQAGLFGTSAAVARLLNALLEIYGGRMMTGPLSREMVSLLLTVRPGAKRTFGFDTPDRDNSSAGRMFSGTTVGHLGFTGVSMWLDVAYGIMVLLFTNRVHPDRNNNAIKMFRPLLHDAVMKAVLGAGHYQNQNESAGFNK